MRHLLTILICLCLGRPGAAAERLLRFDACRLLEHAANDGDSFHLQAGSTSFVARLYFVDCPEIDASSDAMERRVREQQRFFGLRDKDDVLQFGRTASKTTRDLLAAPFTVETAFSAWTGATATPRYYAFITLADGRDLAAVLVGQGFARAHGVGRARPDGVGQEEQWTRLRDMEAVAMLRHAGIWAHADADHLAESRATERREVAERDASRRKVDAGGIGQVNINLASQIELEALPAIGPVLARAIIAGRPYTNTGDLLRVPGIRARTMDRIQPFLTTQAVDATPAAPPAM